MLTDYCTQYYLPQESRTSEMVADSYAKAKSIAAWKAHMLEGWNDVKVVSYTQPEASYTLSPEGGLKSEVTLELGNILPEEIGVEMLFTSVDRKGRLRIQDVFELELAG
jgi:hypothetical protein